MLNIKKIVFTWEDGTVLDLFSAHSSVKEELHEYRCLILTHMSVSDPQGWSRMLFEPPNLGAVNRTWVLCQNSPWSSLSLLSSPRSTALGYMEAESHIMENPSFEQTSHSFPSGLMPSCAFLFAIRPRSQIRIVLMQCQ